MCKIGKDTEEYFTFILNLAVLKLLNICNYPSACIDLYRYACITPMHASEQAEPQLDAAPQGEGRKRWVQGARGRAVGSSRCLSSMRCPRQGGGPVGNCPELPVCWADHGPGK